MPKKKKVLAPEPSPLEQAQSISELIYGNNLCEEMRWADRLVRFSAAYREKNNAKIPPHLLAEWNRREREEIEVVVTAMCTAAFKGNPGPFERLAKFIAWAKDSGRHTDSAAWKSDLAQCMLAYAGGPGAPINMTEFTKVRDAQRGRSEDFKTLYRCARKLGLILTAGSPRGKREKR